MDDVDLRLRIRVISVSTRAAVNSLDGDDPQVRAVLERGGSLLEELEPLIAEAGSEEVRQALAEARAELAALNP